MLLLMNRFWAQTLRPYFLNFSWSESTNSDYEGGEYAAAIYFNYFLFFKSLKFTIFVPRLISNRCISSRVIKQTENI